MPRVTINKKGKVVIRPSPTWEEIKREHPLGEFLVPYRYITESQVVELEKCLKSARDERPLQKFFESNPIILSQHLQAGERFVIPRKRFGSEFQSDFIIGEHHSAGYDWQVVEIESPRTPLFTKKGNPRAELTHAIRQIQDWRSWLQQNQNYASRLRIKSGLGLTDIRADVRGLILIGRRPLLDDRWNSLRQQMASDLKIKIHTYDYLLECARARIDWLKTH